jgi:hypothetical protein
MLGPIDLEERSIDGTTCIWVSIVIVLAFESRHNSLPGFGVTSGWESNIHFSKHKQHFFNFEYGPVDRRDELSDETSLIFYRTAVALDMPNWVAESSIAFPLPR